MGLRHRVESKRGPTAPPPPLLADTWHDGTFTEASGEEWTVIWGGVGPLPGSETWPPWLVARTESEARGGLRLTSRRGR